MSNQNDQNSKRHYSNGVNIHMSAFDIMLEFSTQLGEKKEDVSQIVMSPQHAKLLSKMLASYVSRYEEIFGDIPEAVNKEKLEQLKNDGLVEVQK